LWQHLLVTSVRHLPWWKSEKHPTAWLQKPVQLRHESRLIGNVLNHILQDDQVKFGSQINLRHHIVNVLV